MYIGCVEGFKGLLLDTVPVLLVRTVVGDVRSIAGRAQDAVEAVIGILGMAPCDGTDAVPPNARSHTVLLSGEFIGSVQALVRLSFGIDAQRTVAMKLVSRAGTPEVSEAIHHIIEEA